ncbi:MAG: radical SAM protein [Candidatus Aminicenantes bacterium]|nr:radical SAM protein [Candidatus Aminicenantes bacterium]
MSHHNQFKDNKILLLSLPFWTPLVPPQGIAHLKHFLQYHGFIVKTKDANTVEEFKELYNKYFELLRLYVPADKQGNFFNIGHDVMRNHLSAHIHYKNEDEYRELVKIIVYRTYFTELDRPQVDELNGVLTEFYRRLENYILNLLKEEDPGVLGISVYRDTIGPSMFSFRLAKEKHPAIKTVMGGSVFSDHLLKGTPNFEFFLEKAPYIDHIIIGEGQNLFLKLLQHRLPETQRVFTLEDINGETLGDSTLNAPDMTDFHVRRDYPYLSGQASSSCPNQCSFCNVAAFWGKYREKDPKQTVAEMTALYKTYGNQLFFMNDSLLNHIAPALSEEFIKSGVALYWDGYLRVDDAVCDLETTLQWRRGGFYRARLGVESGSQHVLDLIHKGITPAQIKEALYSLAHAGVKTTAYWVIGHPGETADDFQQTLELLEEIKDYIYEAECNPFIYGYGGQADAENWKDKRKLLYPEDADDLLVIRSWYVDDSPSREETYQRVSRFAQCCDRLGIPNPYSLHDIYLADKRWQMLHKNAVPPVADFGAGNAYIDECKYVKQKIRMTRVLEEDGDFGF